MDFNKIFVSLICLSFISTSYGQLELVTSDLAQKDHKTKITVCFANSSSEELILKSVLKRMYYLSQHYEKGELKKMIDTVKIDRMGFIIENETGEPLQLEDHLNIKLHTVNGLSSRNLPLQPLKMLPNSKACVRTKIIYKNVRLPQGNYNLEVFYYNARLDKLFVSDAVLLEL